MDGVLNVNKPAGLTSFDVVARVRRWSGEKRVGHGGTLDPLATGVLPLFLGQATRFLEFTSNHRKVYRATVRLGVVTDTYDADGAVTASHDASGITAIQVESLLAELTGSIMQSPPGFSAVKVGGKRAYSLARRGQSPVIAPRQVEVFRLTLSDWRPPELTLEVECGPGTYVRSLAHDLGQRLGCGAHMSALVRLASGPFTIDDSMATETVETAFQDGSWRRIMRPPDWVLAPLESVVLGSALQADMVHGKPIAKGREPPIAWVPGRYCRAYATDGAFLGVLKASDKEGVLLPYKVLASPFRGY